MPLAASHNYFYSLGALNFVCISLAAWVQVLMYRVKNVTTDV
jgi:hypothetical protein